MDRLFRLLDGHIRVVHTTPRGEQIIALHIGRGQIFSWAESMGLAGWVTPSMA